MILKEFSPDEKPRERLFTYGIENLSNSEVLAIILQSGIQGENVIDLSNRILSKYNFNTLQNLSLQELIKIRGIGPANASKLLASFELSKRTSQPNLQNKKINTAQDIANYFIPKLKNKKKEYFYCVFLDTKNKIIKSKLIAIGTLNSSMVHPREIFKPAIKESSNSIILLHNHPSGDPTPSKEDIIITKRIIKAGKLISIQVIDHIIIGTNDYWSYNENKK